MKQVDAGGQVLSVAQVAAMMRVSTMTVYRLIEGRELAATRVGRTYRVREGDVSRLLGERYADAG